MSGIGAILSLDGSGIPISDVERMAAALKPYGRDEQNIKVMHGAGAAFVFCLHKLVPEDSVDVQPQSLADRIFLLFDGRIDNRNELGELLGISSSELRVLPDSGIALRLFDRFGPCAFEQIVGVFATIVMDLQDGRLFCARDHIGMRCLHYHQSEGRFSVATAPEALFALGWVPQTLNKEDLADTLAGRTTDGERTHYTGVYRVLPGCILEASSSNVRKQKFWHPERIAEVRYKDDRDYVAAFQEHLDQAVRACLRTRKMPCAMITGGLDSSSISVVAADLMAQKGAKLNTFTAVPETGFLREDLPGRYFDETPYVREIARENSNIIPHFITQNSDPLTEKIASVVQMSGLIGATLNCLWGVDLLAAAREKGHDVMLGGEMGNTTISFNGYGLLTELMLKGHWVQLFREINASGHRRHRLVRQMLIRPVIPKFIFTFYKKWRRGKNSPWYNFSILRPEFAAQYRVMERAEAVSEGFDAAPSYDSKTSRIYDLRSNSELADWHAKVRAHFNIDHRTPAVDRRVVEFCLGIPLSQYLRDGQNRWLIRRAMKERLPESVITQKKYGAQAADWYSKLSRDRHQICDEVKRLSNVPEVASILDMQRLSSMLEKWPDCQPQEYSPEQGQLLAIPDCLGAAYFIEGMTRRDPGVANVQLGQLKISKAV